MLEDLFDQISKKAQLTKRDIGEFAVMKKKGMTFTNEAYEMADFGRMSTMKMSAMLGMMRMESVVITPLDKDMPLLSFDYIKAMGKQTIIIEMYDVNLKKVVFADEFNHIKDQYKNISNYLTKSAWYDAIKYKQSIAKTGKKIDEEIADMCEAYLNVYFDYAAKSFKCKRKEKALKVQKYVDGLLKNGGASTSTFLKLFGKEKTEEFFNNYMFGTKLGE